MADVSFEIGQLVWAKMKGFSPWPAKIADPENQKPPKNKAVRWVFFFGTNNYAWIDEVNLKSYNANKSKYSQNCKTAQFKEACEQIEEYIKDPDSLAKRMAAIAASTDDNTRDVDEEFDKLRENNLDDTVISSIGTPLNTPPKPVSSKKRTKTNSAKTAVIKQKSNARSSIAIGSPPSKRRRNSDHHSARINNIDLNDDEFDTPRGNPASRLLSRPIIPPGRPDTPELDIATVSKTLMDRNIDASPLTFGFLGLGIMGRGIVKNLLNSGHKVIVWNRNFAKCRKFEKAGASSRATPMDVVEESDITFCCVSDPKAVKEVVFGNCGVLQCPTFDGKAYVEMSTIDSELSHDLDEAIQSKCGTYLEAQIQGSKVDAEEGNLTILAAGDANLFTRLQSCFKAMSKNSFYLGGVGFGCKMNLVLQTLAGITVAGLGEALALAERVQLKIQDVIEILKNTHLSSPLVLSKANCILKGDYATQHPLQHLQKDMKLAIALGDSTEQPLPLTSACNEILKTAKRRGYGEHDSSAVYVVSRL